MANRRANKQLRIAARERMARTGETYQQARAQILDGRARTHEARPSIVEQRAPRSANEPAPRAGGTSPIEADLLPIRYFGEPAALATFAIAGRISVLVLSTSHRTAPFPLNPLVGLGPRRSVH